MGQPSSRHPRLSLRRCWRLRTALAIGSKKLPVDAALRGPALELSLLLVLIWQIIVTLNLINAYFGATSCRYSPH